MGTFSVNSVPAQVLFDSGASHSFVTESFVNRSGMKAELLTRVMSVQIPGSRVTAHRTCLDIPIEICGVTFPAELIVLGTKGIDVILGMNWLSRYRGRIDCTERTVNLTSADGVQIEYTDKTLPEPSVIRVSRCHPLRR